MELRGADGLKRNGARVPCLCALPRESKLREKARATNQKNYFLSLSFGEGKVPIILHRESSRFVEATGSTRPCPRLFLNRRGSASKRISVHDKIKFSISLVSDSEGKRNTEHQKHFVVFILRPLLNALCIVAALQVIMRRGWSSRLSCTLHLPLLLPSWREGGH